MTYKKDMTPEEREAYNAYHREYARHLTEDQKKRRREASRRFYRNHHEKCLADGRKYYAKHRDEIKARQRARYHEQKKQKLKCLGDCFNCQLPDCIRK